MNCNAYAYYFDRYITATFATVILIAITLIAAVAIAGFVFGLFGTLSSGANVQVITTSCRITNSTVLNTCLLSLSNTGNAPASVTSCSLYGATLTASGPAATSVGAGKSGVHAYCGPASGTFSAGQSVSGSVTMSNGVTIPFAGTWS